MALVRCAQFTLYRVYIMVTHSMSKGLDELKTANTFFHSIVRKATLLLDESDNR